VGAVLFPKLISSSIWAGDAPATARGPGGTLDVLAAAKD
jgi:hypothetical protein